MSAVDSGKQRALLQEAQALSAQIRSLPLDPGSLAGSYSQLFDLVKLVKHFLDATAAMPQGQQRAMWEQRGNWLKEEISSLALERVQSGGSAVEFAGNLLSMLMAAADACQKTEQDKRAEIVSVKELLGHEIARLEAATAAAVADAAEAKGRAAAAGAAAERQSQQELELQQLQMDMAALQAAHTKTEAAAAHNAAEAREALHNLQLTREERDRLAAQLEVLQRAHRAAAGETHGQAEVIRVMMSKSEQLNRQLAAVTRERDELTIDNQALHDELDSQAKVVERLIALNEELMEAANMMAAKQQRRASEQQQQALEPQQQKQQQNGQRQELQSQLQQETGQQQQPEPRSPQDVNRTRSTLQAQQQQQQQPALKQPVLPRAEHFVSASPHHFKPTLDPHLHPCNLQQQQQHAPPMQMQQQQQQQHNQQCMAAAPHCFTSTVDPHFVTGSNQSTTAGIKLQQQSPVHKVTPAMHDSTPPPPPPAAAGVLTPSAPLPASPMKLQGMGAVDKQQQQQQHAPTAPPPLGTPVLLTLPPTSGVLSPKQQPQQQQQQWLGSLRTAVGQQQQQPHQHGIAPMQPVLLPQAPSVRATGQGLGFMAGMPLSKTPWMPSAAAGAGGDSYVRPAGVGDSGQPVGEVQEAVVSKQQQPLTALAKGDEVSALGSAFAAFLTQD